MIKIDFKAKKMNKEKNMESKRRFANVKLTIRLDTHLAFSLCSPSIF